MTAPDELRISQLKALVKYAGWFDLPLLAKAVGVSQEDVVRAAGFYGIDLRRFDSKAVWCSRCGCQRIPGRLGCPVCAKREAYERASSEEHEAWAALTNEERIRITSQGNSMGKRKSAVDSMTRPLRADYQPARPWSEYSRREAAEQYALDLQSYDLARVNRDYKRSRRRVNRWMAYARERGAS